LTDEILTATDVTLNLELIHFFTTTLAHLPYEFMEEPLLMVYWINRNIMVSSTMLTTTMKNSLLALGAKDRIAEEMQPPAIGSMPKRLSRAVSNTSTASTATASSSSSTNTKSNMRKGKSSSDGNLKWGEGDLVIDEALFNSNTDAITLYATALLMAAEARYIILILILLTLLTLLTLLILIILIIILYTYTNKTNTNETNNTNNITSTNTNTYNNTNTNNTNTNDTNNTNNITNTNTYTNNTNTNTNTIEAVNQ